MIHEVDERCLEPFDYLSKIPGKDVRGSLIDCFQQWLCIDSCTISTIKDIVASLHNASLLVDDIEDNSKLRRGRPVAHSIFGIASTINCANYVYFLALEKCQSLQNAEATSIFVKELLNLHRGQGQDILWRDRCECPTEDEYKRMVLDKTGGLFRLAVGLMQCFSGENRHKDFTGLLNLLGLYFQIRDDYLNISSNMYMQSKSFCEDLTEGKFSFVIIHAVNTARKSSNDGRLLSILRQRTEDIDVKKYAVGYMNSLGSIEYTRNTLRIIRQQIEDEIVSLGGHSSLQALINHLDCQLDIDIDDIDSGDITQYSSNDNNNIHINKNSNAVGKKSSYDYNNNNTIGVKNSVDEIATL